MTSIRDFLLQPRLHAIVRSTMAVSVGLGLLCFTQNTFAQKAGSAQEDDIREAIVRYQIANWDLRADVYFVEIQSKDPTNEFLLRFADIPKSVEKKSASRIRKEVSGNHVEEKRTRKRGVIFDQESIVWIGDARVDVEGGYYCAVSA